MSIIGNKMTPGSQALTTSSGRISAEETNIGRDAHKLKLEAGLKANELPKTGTMTAAGPGSITAGSTGQPQPLQNVMQSAARGQAHDDLNLQKTFAESRMAERHMDITERSGQGRSQEGMRPDMQQPGSAPVQGLNDVAMRRQSIDQQIKANAAALWQKMGGQAAMANPATRAQFEQALRQQNASLIQQQQQLQTQILGQVNPAGPGGTGMAGQRQMQEDQPVNQQMREAQIQRQMQEQQLMQQLGQRGGIIADASVQRDMQIQEAFANRQQQMQEQHMDISLRTGQGQNQRPTRRTNRAHAMRDRQRSAREAVMQRREKAMQMRRDAEVRRQQIAARGAV